jgi:hypothetical protein
MENVTNRLLGEMLLQQQPTPEPIGPLSRLARALARGVEGARQGFGEREIGMPAEFRARYPGVAVWQPIAGTVDIAGRSIPAAARGVAGMVAGAAESAGMSEAGANRLQRDLNMVGHMFEPRRPRDVQSSEPTKRELRMTRAWKDGFGDRELGIPADMLARYPYLAYLQPDARDIDKLARGWSGALRGGAGFVAGLAEDSGMDEASANRLERDLNALAEIAGARRLGR